MPLPDNLFDDAPKASGGLPDNLFDEATPKEGGILGWVKGKVAESEARRKEMLKNPVKSVLTAAANVPLPLPMPGSIIRHGRQALGIQEPTALERYLPDPTVGSVVKGVVDMPIKGAQIASHAYDAAFGNRDLSGLVAPQPLAADRAANFVDRIYRDPTVIQSNMGEMTGQALLPLGIGAKAKSTAEAVKDASRAWKALKGAAAGSATAVTASPDVNVQSNEDFASRQIVPAVVGGGVGAAAPLVAEGLAAGGEKFLRWLAPKFNPEKAAKIIEWADKLGVNMRPSTIVKASQDPAREVADAEGAVNRLSKKFKGDMLATPFTGLDDIVKASQTPGKRQGAATALLDYVKTSGLDPEDVLKTSAKIRGLQEKMRLDELALVRDSLAQKVQAADVSPLVSAIDEGVEKLRMDSRGGHDALIKELQAWRSRLTAPSASDHLGMANTGRSPVVIQNGVPTQGPAASDSLGLVEGSPVVIRNGVPTQEVRDAYGTIVQRGQEAVPVIERGPSGASPATSNKAPVFQGGGVFGGDHGNPRSFQSLSVTRSNLSNDISSLYKGANSQTGSAPAYVLQPLKDALDTTIEKAAQESGIPQLAAADKIFRREYSKFKTDYADPVIRQALETKDPDALIGAIRRMGENKAQRLFDSLDPRGQKAFLSGLWDEVTKGAWNKRTGDFIPGNVSGGMFDAAKALGVSARGENAQALAGMNVVMQSLAKSDPKLASALGQRFVEGAMGEVSPKGAVAVRFLEKIKDKGIDWLFDSPAGKDFLFKAGSMKPNSPAYIRLVETDAPRILGMKTGSVASSATPQAASTGTPDLIAENK